MISIPSFIAGIPQSDSTLDEVLNNNVAIPLLDSLGVILSISLCLIVLRVKLFKRTHRERDVHTLSNWCARSNLPGHEAGEPCEIRLDGIGSRKDENDPKDSR